MHKLAFLLLLATQVALGQSKSIRAFRSDFKESSNFFLYSSTLKMLNPDGNPGFADMVSGIDEIRVLNYDLSDRQFDQDDLVKLRNDLADEGYETLMHMNEKGSGIDLMGRQRRGKNTGVVAIVENREATVLIDIIGNVDLAKFMELWQEIDAL